MSMTPSHQDRLQDWWTSRRKQIQKEERKGFDSFVTLISWTLRKQRNNRVFHSGNICSVLATVEPIFAKIRQWALAGGGGVHRYCE
uniref:Uncharacterized protein n=1 Tax=Triticum urartu TaxID=4572 RepID=A0A8R7QPS5_TRIUA